MTRSSVALFGSLLVLAACQPHSARSHDTWPSESSSSQPRAPRGEPGMLVVFQPAGHADAQVQAEVVRTPEAIEHGLMYRKYLPPDHGMLFFMGTQRVHSFWMHNTYIPLDMVFIGKDMRVAGVVANTEPLTDDSRSVERPSLYVLEVNAGWAARNRVRAGTPVAFVPLPR